MDFVLETAYWIAFFAVMTFAVIGLKRWYKKLAAALIIAALGLYVGISWYKQQTVDHAKTERLRTSKALEQAAGDIRTRIDYLTREAMDFQFGRRPGPPPDRSVELRAIRAKLDAMHQQAVEAATLGPRLTIESLETQLESLRSLSRPPAH